MSKRLKLHLGGEAEMEERAFTNPFPDYEAALAAAGLTTGTSEESGCVRTQSTTDELGLPFHHDGKVSRRPCLGKGPAGVGVGRQRW